VATERDVVIASATAIWLAVVGFLVTTAIGGLAAPVLRDAGVAVGELPAEAVFKTLVPPLGFGGVAVAFAVRSRHVSIPYEPPDRRDLAWVVGGPIVLLVVLLGLSAVANALGLPEPSHGLLRRILDSGRAGLLLVLIPLSIVFTGPGEELLFRGAIQGRLRLSMGPVPAILGASALFAVVHAGAFWGPGVVVALAQVFVLTLLLGAAYERRDNIVVPALIHGLYNALQFATTYVTTAGV
jgi:membrane protease YdiL (CAAX protease family)